MFFKCFLDKFELLDHLLNQIQVLGLRVLLHDESNDCLDERVYEQVSHWTQQNVKDESEDSKEGAYIHYVFLEGKVLDLRNGLSKVKSDRIVNLLQFLFIDFLNLFKMGSRHHLVVNSLPGLCALGLVREEVK